ncbi:MAG TPA: amidohydrolase family protein [Dehalococcoidia bacterium]
MLIADAQVHIWAADTPGRPWPTDRQTPPQKPYPVTKELILAGMDEAGVDRVVLVPPSWEGDRNDVALEAAHQHPSRFAVMGRIALEDASNRELIASWRDQPGMLGIRCTFHADVHRQMLADGSAGWLWEAAERAAVPIMVYVPGSVALIDAVAERHPGLKLIIDHLAVGGRKDDEAFARLPEVVRLSRFENVAVKASALPLFSSEPYPYRNIHGYIRQVYDAFGPARMFWGTDWTRLPCPWRQAVTLMTEELPWLTAADKEQIMGRAICSYLGWAPD